MIAFHPLFAQQTLPIDIVSGAPWKKMDSATRDILVILGAMAVVTLLVVAWAVVFRKRRRRRSHSHSHHHSASREHAPTPESKPEDSSTSESGEVVRKRRRRHRRREHRPRNPTLAETGGLPPLRTGRPPDPYP